MVERCHLPSHNSYPNYGGRGIFVCDRWSESKGRGSHQWAPGFLAFLEDMESTFEKGLQIERIEGIMFLVIYAAYTAYLVLDGTGNDAADWFGLIALVVITPLSLAVIASATIRQRWKRMTRAHEQVP